MAGTAGVVLNTILRFLMTCVYLYQCGMYVAGMP